MSKPSDVFDRDREWAALDRFVSAERPGATLGLVYGRRRQGKTYLLEALCETAGGVYIAALEQSQAQNLARVADAYRRARGGAGLVVFGSWEEALSAVLSLGEDASAPTLVVIDELPYLLRGAPELPSVLQALLSPRSAAATRSRTRLVLCGSALSTMEGLLAGGAPLRGRATLELMVHPFSYRDAARFWGTAHDPVLSMLLHALVGGTPAYREMCGTAPSSVAEIDEWATTTLLDPASAMFREGNTLLAEEARIADAAVYFSVLGAIARGATRRVEIAAATGRPEGALAHSLSALADARLIAPLADAFKLRRTTYHIAEPVLRLHQLVIAPHEGRLVRHRAGEVWAEVADTVSTQVYGPHFEHLARTWCAEHASQETLGGTPSRVAPTVVACREHRESHELDVVVLEKKAQARERVVALGEAKWRTVTFGVSHLARLEHCRDLLGADGAKLLCFSKEGFSPALVDASRTRPDVELIDPSRLYGSE